MSDPSSVKRRSSRACDQCRKTKGKCERRSMDDACGSCASQNLECTTSGPNLKRGPPKGYLRAVETHMHELEALLGVILSTPDQNFRQILRTIAEDPFAKTVITRVEGSAFGPESRMRLSQRDSGGGQGSGESSEWIYDPANKDGNPFVVGPTNQWQNHVLSKVLGVKDADLRSNDRQMKIITDTENTKWEVAGQEAYQKQYNDAMYSMPETPVDSVSEMESIVEDGRDFDEGSMQMNMNAEMKRFNAASQNRYQNYAPSNESYAQQAQAQAQAQGNHWYNVKPSQGQSPPWATERHPVVPGHGHGHDNHGHGQSSGQQQQQQHRGQRPPR